MSSPDRHMKEKVILALIFLGFSPYLPAAQFTVGELMEALANNTQGAATFTETKYLGIPDQPVEASGGLLFVPPDRLGKLTLIPQGGALIVKGEDLHGKGPLHNPGLTPKG